MCLADVVPLWRVIVATLIILVDYWDPSQYPKRRLFVRSRKVSKPGDWYFKLPYRFEIWQAHRQQCCRRACHISKRSDNSEYKSRGFETLRDLTKRRLLRILRRGPGGLRAGMTQVNRAEQVNIPTTVFSDGLYDPRPLSHRGWYIMTDCLQTRFSKWFFLYVCVCHMFWFKCHWGLVLRVYFMKF